MVISKLITEPVAGLSPDDISRLLADMIDTNMVKIDEPIVIVPREKTLVRYLRLPSTTETEIENMISFEIAKQIPYSKEEVISDYRIISTDTDGYSEVMLVVAHKNEIEWLNNILSAKGIRPNKIRLSSESISNSLQALNPERFKDKNICVIDIDSDSTEIIIVSYGRLLFSRVASAGAADTTATEEQSQQWAGRIIDEIKRSIAMYIKERKDETADISEFLVTGASSVGENFSNILQQEMGLGCSYMNILSSFQLANNALTDKGIAKDSSIYAVCGGMFNWEGVNLIPEALRKKQKLQIRLTKLVSTSVLLAVIIFMTAAMVLVKLYQKERLLARLEAMLKQIEPRVSSTEEKLKKLDVLKEHFSQGASSLEAIYHLYKLIPGDISLVDFDYDDASRSVRFRGRAQRMSDVFKLTTTLEGSERFSNVQMRSVDEKRMQQGSVVDFQIRCSFIPES
jgi:Tfp pilus assembly PilM family ATPase